MFNNSKKYHYCSLYQLTIKYKKDHSWIHHSKLHLRFFSSQVSPALPAFTEIISHDSKFSTVFVVYLFVVLFEFLGFCLFVFASWCLLVLISLTFQFWFFSFSIFFVSPSPVLFCLEHLLPPLLHHFDSLTMFSLIHPFSEILLNYYPIHAYTYIFHAYVQIVICFLQHTSHTSNFRDIQRHAICIL